MHMRFRAGWKKLLSPRVWMLVVLLGLLPVLALMQYRWIGQVSEAERQRRQAALETSVAQFVTDFDSEITRAYLTFQPVAAREGQGLETRFAERYREWNRLAPYSRLMRGLYVIERNGELRLWHATPAGGITSLSKWPEEIADLRSNLLEAGRPGPPGFRPFGAGALSAERQAVFVMPIPGPRPAPNRPRTPPAPRAMGWTIVVLDAEYIQREFLPDLLRRHFMPGGESNYEIVVERAIERGEVVFQSESGLRPGQFAKPDASAGFFGIRPECFLPPAPAGGGMGPRRFSNGLFRPGAVEFPEVLGKKPVPCGHGAGPPGPGGERWRLLVKYRAGSLDRAIATFRQRSLLISFGVLLVLAGGITMLAISAERARALARRQVEFAIGVSHELRTPLAVIRVAADNLADGIVGETGQARKYGDLIRTEARRLHTMIEQVLAFSRSQSLQGSCDLAPVAPEEIVERALAASMPALREAGFEIEQTVQPDLPPVRADAGLISQCLQNLLNNAVKYGRAGGWVGMRAQSSTDRQGARVNFIVQDRGPGIPPEELAQIFEPFFRGQQARESQIPGIGLGLSFVKRVVEAHHGALEVKSSGLSGTSFILSLPVENTR
jgi:signal transduction histidine kinase